MHPTVLHRVDKDDVFLTDNYKKINTSKREFIEKYGSQYGYEGAIDELREREFARLKDIVFLDHAGTGLYAESQMRKCFDNWNSSVFGNPHSVNPSSLQSAKAIAEVREIILSFFNTTSKDYSVVFTAGCTAALKLIGETFPWTNASKFYYHNESHTSVLGIREYVQAKKAQFQAMSLEQLLQLGHHVSESTHPTAKHLIAFPAQNNFSGTKLPLQLVNEFRSYGSDWKVLVDAAAHVGHSKLDLTAFPADFVTLSFYKMFGFPTGLGALIVRNDVAHLLEKTYFGGGTVAAVLSDQPYKVLRPTVHERLEDGTVSFLNIVALRHGFEILQNLGMHNIEAHVHTITQYTYSKLQAMTHSNGKKVCVVYGNHYFNDSSKQGPILTFNLLRDDGTFVGYNEVEQLASLNKIHLRTGCFCNPGACHKYLSLTSEEVIANLEAGHICWDDKDIIKGKPTGAIRISFGYMSTFEDVQAFLGFVQQFFVSTSDTTQTESTLNNSETQIQLESIYVYPIKSCGRFETREWEITSHGLLYDREWVLVDPNGGYLNQKKLPKLCLIRPTIDEENNSLNIDAPNMPTISVSLTSFPEEEVDLRVCGDSCVGYKYPDEVNQWFTKFLDFNCFLVRNLPEKSQRISGGRAARSTQRRDAEIPDTNVTAASAACPISFSNESQFLLVNSASVAELNKKIPDSKVSVYNFRPNLVVKGALPFAEDNWKEISIGNQRLNIIGPCNRCKMICVDQDSANESREPLLTLATFRRDKGRILFGMHAEHSTSESQVPFKLQCNTVVSVKEINKR